MHRTYKLLAIGVLVLSCTVLLANALFQESEDMMMKMSSPREIIKIEREEPQSRESLTDYWVLTNSGELKKFTQLGDRTEPIRISSPPSLGEDEWKKDYTRIVRKPGHGMYDKKIVYQYTDDQAFELFRKVLEIRKQSEEKK